MLTFPASQGKRRARQGVALVVVLAFVLLLTAIAVAFFSRALSERQISNLAVNQIKADTLAQGAADTVISDFRQEIAAGSLVYTATSTMNYVKATGATLDAYPLFVPRVQSGSGNVAPTMVPALVIAGAPSPAPLPIPTPTPGMENLIKQSAGGQPFFPSDPNNAYYDSTTYKPSTRAPRGSGANTAGSPWEASSAKPSLNGRFISPARWNKALLLPATDATHPEPPTSVGFIPPDWVLVARDGSNPTSWNSSLKNTANLATTVVGRFAYNVYDEGGLLDANVAGFPAPTASSTPSPTTGGQFGYYKNALAYADLTQLTNLAGSQLLNQSQIDALVGWRNNASANAPNPFPGPGFTDASRTAYYSSILLNPTGFLSINGLSGLTANNQSDRMFSGRQTLINLMKVIGDPSKVPNSDPVKTQDALRFLGTFSRSLNQPSFVRVQKVDSNAPGYDLTAPKLLAPNAGGNNAGGDTTTGLAYNTSFDTQINPTFLAVRAPTTTKATATTGRFDGSDLVQGEPLVKKRFSLNRLAWLTYKGPSALNMSDPIVQKTIKAMGGDPNNSSDPVYQFVLLGNAGNIANYFGLRWGSVQNIDGGVNGWVYDQHNGGSGAIMKVGRPPSVTTPDATSFVQDAGREPDFFELLKASINVGSIAKAGTLPPSKLYRIPHFIAQYETDSRVDDAIIQIGANIIDQFDLDNYPTHISFNDGGGAREFYGVEDLPYLYDVHPVVLKVAPPVTTPALPAATGSLSYYYNADNTAIGSPAYKVTDTGIGATMLIPELWNPHDWDASTQQKLDQTLGIPDASPISFRIYAKSDTAVVLQSEYGEQAQYNANNNNSNGYVSRGFPVAGEPRTVDESNTIMTFGVSHDQTGAQLFREPTLLYRPGHPGGSGLRSAAIETKSGLGALAAGVPTAFAGGGLVTTVGDLSYPPVVNTPYIGMYLGSVPLIWQNKPVNPAAPTPDELKIWRGRFVTLDKVLYPHGVQMAFYLQYQDAGGNWVTYDQKNVTLGHKGIGYGKIAAPMHQTWAGFLEPTIEGDRHYFVLDPRTSRFAMQVSSVAPDTSPTTPVYLNLWSWPPFAKPPTFFLGDTGPYQRWMDPTGFARSAFAPTPAQNEGILPSLRDGWGIGGNLQTLDYNTSTVYDLIPANFPTAMGFYPGNAGSDSPFGPKWSWSQAKYSFRPGIFSQNVPYRMWSDRLEGDNEQMGSGSGSYNASDVAPQFFADADGVVRRGMGGWADIPTGDRTGSMSVWNNNYAELIGLPMRRAHVFVNGQLQKTDIYKNYPPSVPSVAAPLLAAESRPMILNRPFRSVAELGYTFSGTPWRNLTFNAPESGDSALLDVFCVNDTENTDGLVAGRVNLNTRQSAVLRAVIAGAYRSESDTTLGSASSSVLADTLAKRLVARTTGVIPSGVTINGTGIRPLQNLSELVGRWTSSPKAAGFNVPNNAAGGPVPYDPYSYDGFSADLFNAPYFTSASNKTTDSDGSDPVVTTYPDSPSNASHQTSNAFAVDKTVGRRREAPIRALANVGQTRVWNLLIDVVAQTGRYPQTATAFDKFAVEGEQRYWVHVAIDRFTGNVIDKQIEVVNE